MTGSVLLHRELRGTTTAGHDRDGTIARTTGVHKLTALLLRSRFLDLSRYLDFSWHLDRPGLLYLSLRFGLGDLLPDHPERERTGYQR